MIGTRTLAFSTAILLLSAAPTLAAEQRNLLERLWYAQGHTHPIVVHFPIALLMAAAVAASLRPFTQRVTNHVVYFCLLLGTGGAILSCFAGWAWAPQEKAGYDIATDSNSPIFWHRWGGVGITVLSLGVLIWASLSLRKHGARQWPWQAAVIAIAMATGWVGHEGGELVYDGNAAKIFGIASGSRNVELHQAKTVSTPTSGSLFATKIWPVFEAKCIDCHGAEKQKGKFRMDTEEFALAGGDNMQPLYIKGKSSDSALIKHVTASEDDEDFPLMPPKSAKRSVTREEVEVFRKWIDEGAKWDKK